MKSLRLIYRILKATNTDKMIIGFLGNVLVMALLLVIFEPNINNYFDGLWYCYTVIFTVGFGDIVTTSLIGKIISIILSLLGVFIIAIVTSVVVNVYNETLKVKDNNSISKLLDDLENLEDMSKEELVTLSNNIKKIRRG